MRPHRRQPTRLPCPWDSPGKNTGVGCHFLLQCVKVKMKSLSCVQLLATQWTTAYQAPPSMGFSRQEYWSGVQLPSPGIPFSEFLNLCYQLIALQNCENVQVNQIIRNKWSGECSFLSYQFFINYIINTNYTIFCIRNYGKFQLLDSSIPEIRPTNLLSTGTRCTSLTIYLCVYLYIKIYGPDIYLNYILHVHVLSRFSCVQLFATDWTITHQATLSVGFFRQEYQSGLPCPPPGDLPDPGIKAGPLASPALAGRFFTTSVIWEAHCLHVSFHIYIINITYTYISLYFIDIII